jgi:hypothetical protein
MTSASESRAFQHRLCGFGLFLLFLGVVGMAGIQVAKRRIGQTAQWPSVKGTVVTSEVVTGTVKNGRTLIVSPHANTVYTFAVDGKSYRGEGRRVVPMLHFDTEGTPEEVVAKYPKGKAVTVYFDPNNPADALLTPVPGKDAQELIGALTLIAPVVAGVGLLIAGMAGTRLWRERGLVPQPAAVRAAVAVDPLPPMVVEPRPAESPRPPKPRRATHWIVRGVATLLGLGLFSFGSLVSVTVARMNAPQVSGVVQVVMFVIFAFVTLLGAFLIWVGMRRPRVTLQAA